MIVATTGSCVIVHDVHAAGPQEKQLAEALFRDARQLLEQNRTREACVKFEESQRLEPKIGTLLNLAVCHERLGRTASAWAEFVQAQEEARRSDMQEREEFARTHAQTLEPRLSRLVIRPPMGVPGVTLSLDGVAIALLAASTPFPLDPGDHVVEARAPGYLPFRAVVTLAEADRKEVTIPMLQPEPPKSEPPVRPAPRDNTTSRTLGIVAIGAGAVGIGLGAYFGLRAFSKREEADGYCVGTLCRPEGLALIDEGRTAATVSTVAFVGGAVLATTGVVFLLSASSSRAPVHAWLAPGPRGATVGLRAAF